MVTSCPLGKSKALRKTEATLDTYCPLPHVRVSPGIDRPTPVDKWLAQQNRQRTVVLSLAFFSAAPLVVAQSDLIATGPRRCGRRFEALLALPPFKIALLSEAEAPP